MMFRAVLQETTPHPAGVHFGLAIPAFIINTEIMKIRAACSSLPFLK
jgi:hypothetical protein